MTNAKYQDLNAVLVHAAWADAARWNKVILPLQKLGLRVRSAQIPLTSLTEKDRMISPVTQHFMAERIQARIHSLDVDHTPLASAPEAVGRLIVEAADGVL